MNPRTQEQIAVMQASLEGKRIEARRFAKEEWQACRDPLWDWMAYEYRVAPEPAEPRTFNVWLRGSGQLHERSEDQPAADWVESGFRAATLTEIPPGWKLVPPVAEPEWRYFKIAGDDTIMWRACEATDKTEHKWRGGDWLPHSEPVSNFIPTAISGRTIETDPTGNPLHAANFATP